MTKIFVTGATGFIGGDALYAIATAHPEYQITALVRNSDKGALVAAQHPSVRLVYGDLDDEELLEKEASTAEIVGHFAHADHEAGARALIKGLLAGQASNSKPSFYIHTSGTGNLLFTDIRSGDYGNATSLVYNDLEGVSAVTGLPDDAPHRNVDKIVLEAGANHAEQLKTAIVCPPTIYGAGRGPGSRRSHQLPELARVSLQQGHAVQVGAGLVRWGNIHVHDLSALYVRLVEEAAAGGATADWAGKPAVWGEEGYFFVENGEHSWGEVAEWVAKEATSLKLIQNDTVKTITAEQANQYTKAGAAMWGANSRAKARRAREALKWEAVSTDLRSTIRDAVEVEGKALGLIPGHATKAAEGA